MGTYVAFNQLQPQVHVQQKMAEPAHSWKHTHRKPPFISSDLFYWRIVQPTTKGRPVVNYKLMQYIYIFHNIKIVYILYKYIFHIQRFARSWSYTFTSTTHFGDIAGISWSQQLYISGKVNRETLYRSYKTEERFL